MSQTKPANQSTVTAAPISQQPVGTPGPQLTPQTYFKHRKRQPFQTGLFSCFSDIKLCLCASFCAPCLFNRTSAILESPGSAAAQSEWFGGPCAIYYALAACTGCCQVFYQGSRRGKIREKYNIEGDDADDYCLSCFCTGCALAQEDVEIRKLEQERLLAFQNGQEKLASQNL